MAVIANIYNRMCINITEKQKEIRTYITNEI